MNDKFKDITGSDNWKNIVLIDKGWSSDKKYYINTNNGEQFLLRLSNISEYHTKKDDYELLKQLDELPVIMSRPLAFDVCNDGNDVYTLFTWVDGKDAERIIPMLSDIEQYKIGVQAGEILRKIHETKVRHNLPEWSHRFNNKINRKIAAYEACSIKFEGSDSIINYINENRFLLENRPQVFQHGDYHIGNMTISEKGDLGIIDFNRLDFGDPWEEFNRITFCAGVSKFFASGRINGYFDNNVPDTFFRLLALYIGCNQLSSIPWAIPFGQDDINYMLKQAMNVLEWYKGFKTYIPSWYIFNNEI
ncbi:aminoglycoside phosphotransferase (APT) family kinase protein [Natranaerovirga pectinivora]|uniref:Aminoglycoside phosphotransferase (APT) family kinase protein n=1 Tax=Natranaerovirga pectinivora TaxID=682400 RepID=A0A4R3MPH7_9FIRM|nr:phosphotransferase [Natranaerovirga pectinivora]TCT17195.1 aminoglycoside phosphotransferase (APT) family kinase protein [Natranaerovirga pectinivora]